MHLGLFSRRERWGLSVRGWLLFVGLAIATCFGVIVTIHPFLSITERSPAHLLVVEGWVHDHAIRAAKDEFQAGGYQDVFTTGGPVHGVGAYVNVYSTAASIAAQRLKRDGVPAERVHMAPARKSDRDRTFASAIALRDWMHAHHFTVTKINVITEDVHARRTRLLFQKAFGPDVSVGIIAVPNPDYDANHWWRYSEGVRDVLSETISYAYARFLFHPSPTPFAAEASLPSDS
jgi:uncharacterized SAM-binding protein YcdF (DUF218 family)